MHFLHSYKSCSVIVDNRFVFFLNITKHTSWQNVFINIDSYLCFCVCTVEKKFPCFFFFYHHLSVLTASFVVYLFKIGLDNSLFMFHLMLSPELNSVILWYFIIKLVSVQHTVRWMFSQKRKKWTRSYVIIKQCPTYASETKLIIWVTMRKTTPITYLNTHTDQQMFLTAINTQQHRSGQYMMSWC